MTEKSPFWPVDWKKKRALEKRAKSSLCSLKKGSKDQELSGAGADLAA
jgi:hypothetical protein